MLVSGLLIRSLDALFAPLRLPAIGGMAPRCDFPAMMPSLARHAVVIGAALRQLVAAAVSFDPRVILENKGSSLAVHYRLAPQLEQMLKTKIAAIIARVAVQDIEILHGKAVIEIKSNKFSKGEAVQEMMRSPPFLHRKPVFVGDDITDASVFKVLPMLGGIGYSVEQAVPGASGTFNSPHDVRCWLASLCGREETNRQ